MTDGYAGLPEATTLNGVVSLDLDSPARRSVYRTAYAAGGPACMWCRSAAAEAAVADAAGAAGELAAEFVRSPGLDRLQALMERGLGELLGPAQERRLVAAAFRIREPNCDAVRVRVAQRFWRRYTFVEVNRSPAVSFDDLVVTSSGLVFAATRTTASVPVERLADVRLHLAVPRGGAVPARVSCSFQGRNSGWGMEDPARWSLRWDTSRALTPRGAAPSMLAELTAATLTQ